MTKVIAFVDSSAATRPVLQYAALLAPMFGAHVEAIHVGDDADASATAVAESLGVPLRVVEGDPVARILEFSELSDVVAVVVGTRGRPGGARPAGHVAIALADHTETPVVVVPPDAAVPEHLERVLIAMKGRRGNGRNLKQAIQLVSEAEVDLVVLHVDEEESIPSFSDQVQYEADAYAREFLERFLPGAPDAKVELRVGSPADEILDVVATTHPDLVAFGWPQNDDPNRGRTARELLDRCHGPVLLVATP